MPCFVPVSLHSNLLRLSTAACRVPAVSAVSLQALYKYEPLPVSRWRTAAVSAVSLQAVYKYGPLPVADNSGKCGQSSSGV